MGGEQAATVLTMVGDASRRSPKVRARGQPAYSTARMWDDGTSTRSTPDGCWLGLPAALNAPIPETVFGVFRM